MKNGSKSCIQIGFWRKKELKRTSGDDEVAARRGRDCGASTGVGVVDDVHQLAALGVEGANLAIVPAGDNRLAIIHEMNAMAFEVLDLDAEDLLTSLGVPDANVWGGNGGEDLGVVLGEGDGVDGGGVTGVTELGLERGGATPVDARLGSAAEEILAVLSHGDGGDLTVNLADERGVEFLIVDHVFAENAFAGTDDNVAGGADALAGDASRVGALGALDAQIRVALFDGALEQVAGERAAEHLGVALGYGEVGHDTLGGAALDVLRAELLVFQVESPDAHVTVTGSDETLPGVVEEFDAVCGLGVGWGAADGGTGFDVPNDQGVVVLTAERGEIGVTGGEGQILHARLVQSQAVDDGAALEIPNDSIGGETKMGTLAGSNVSAIVGNGDARNFVVMALEGCVLAFDDVANHDDTTERVEQMLVIGME